MDRNVYIKPILLKTWTKVEFPGQNDDINRNIKSSIAIALWEIHRLEVFKPLMLRISRECMFP